MSNVVNFFLVDHKGPFIRHSHTKHCDARSQGLSCHAIELIGMEYSGPSIRKVNTKINAMMNLNDISLFITPASTKLKGGYTGFTLSICPSVHPSVCPSVRLWTELCPLCIFNNTCQIHFIFAHQATSVGVSRVMLVSKFKNVKFGEFF